MSVVTKESIFPHVIDKVRQIQAKLYCSLFFSFFFFLSRKTRWTQLHVELQGHDNILMLKEFARPGKHVKKAELVHAWNADERARFEIGSRSSSF